MMILRPCCRYHPQFPLLISLHLSLSLSLSSLPRSLSSLPRISHGSEIDALWLFHSNALICDDSINVLTQTPRKGGRKGPTSATSVAVATTALGEVSTARFTLDPTPHKLCARHWGFLGTKLLCRLLLLKPGVVVEAVEEEHVQSGNSREQRLARRPLSDNWSPAAGKHFTEFGFESTPWLCIV
jgi:hypothetical protein